MHIFLPNPSLDRTSLRNPVDPRQQVRELLDLVWREARPLPILHPRPRLDVGDAVLAFAMTGQVLSRLTSGVYAGQLDLKDAEDAQRLVTETGDCVLATVSKRRRMRGLEISRFETVLREREQLIRTWNLFRGHSREMVHLPLIWRPTAVPKEQPL